MIIAAARRALFTLFVSALFCGCQRSEAARPPTTLGTAGPAEEGTIPRAISAADVVVVSPTDAERRREVAALIEMASRSPAEDARALAALAASDRATANVAKTVKAIEVARLCTLENLRNIDTTAFKAKGTRVLDGERVVPRLDMEQGSLANSGRPLDMAIAGDGFFRVKVVDKAGFGIGFTRNGNFFINHAGFLVLGVGDGYQLSPPIAVPTNSAEISISQSGQIEVTLPGKTTRTVLGQIKLWCFVDAGALRSEGSTIYTETKQSGTPIELVPGEGGSGQILQGYLEESNVDLVRERMRIRFLNDWREMLIGAVR